MLFNNLCGEVIYFTMYKIKISGKIHKIMKKAIITGIGQDGSYLAELLLKKGYQVFGIIDDQVHLIHNELIIF